MKNKKSEIPEVQEAMKHVYHETKKTFVGRLVALMLDYLPFTILIIGTIVIFINGLREKR